MNRLALAAVALAGLAVYVWRPGPCSICGGWLCPVRLVGEQLWTD